MNKPAASNPARSARPPLTLRTEVTYLKGCGPALAQRLRLIGLERVHDLLLHLPTRYEDRRTLTPLLRLRDGEEALIRARVLHAEVRFAGRRTLRVMIDDGRSKPR